MYETPYKICQKYFRPVFPSVRDTAPLLRNGAGDLVTDFREVILSSPTRTSRPTKQDKVTDYLYFMSFTVHMKTDYSSVVSVIHVSKAMDQLKLIMMA